MYNIVIIGASLGWTPTLTADLMSVFKEQLHIRLVDLDRSASETCKQWGEAAARHYGRKDTFTVYDDRREALKGADAVIITISTGGLETMAYDIQIPEKYGIFATVGDTAGPSGWSRSIRNIPVFQQFAADFDELCPDAFIANYTNPMSSLTATLAQSCRNPVAGLCHSYFEMKDVMQHIFGLDDWSKISLQIAGMNHFTWLLDFKIGREDGYKLLRDKIGDGSLADLLPAGNDDKYYNSRHELCAELYDTYGYMPYPGDRHTCEFLPYTLSGFPDRYTLTNNAGESFDTIRYCNMKRTAIEQRLDGARRRKDEIRGIVSNFAASAPPQLPRSRETGAEMVHAYLTNEAMTEVVNVPNIGQIPGLPLGACVETFGMIDGLGVRPLVVPNVPEPLLEVMRPQAVNQKWVTEGAMTRNRDTLLQALYNDPQCRHLQPKQVRELADELIAANKPYIAL